MPAIRNYLTTADFATVLPTWDPQMSNYNFGLVDIGSFGISTSVTCLRPPQERILRCVYRESSSCPLFDALAPTGNYLPMQLSISVINRVGCIVARFMDIAGQYNVPRHQITIFATEAVRKAGNASTLLEHIRYRTGIGLHVLDPRLECLLSVLSVESEHEDAAGLFVSLGSVSIQVRVMDDDADDNEPASLPYGTATLTEVMAASTVTAHEREKVLLGLRNSLKRVYARKRARFPVLSDDGVQKSGGLDLYLFGSGFRAFGSMLMHNDPIQPYPIVVGGAYTVPGELFGQVQKLRDCNDNYPFQIVGVSERARKQFGAIATVVEAVIEAVPMIRQVTFCSGDCREGIMFWKLPPDVCLKAPLAALVQPRNLRWDEMMVRTIACAIPAKCDLSQLTTILRPGLSSLFLDGAWEGLGDSKESNAAISREACALGFTHLQRAVLALTLCARWSSALSRPDLALHQSLQRLAIRQESADTVYWAEYIGAVTAVLAIALPAVSGTMPDLFRSGLAQPLVRFSASIKEDNPSAPHIELTIRLYAEYSNGIFKEDVECLFHELGRVERGSSSKYEDMKVIPKLLKL